MRWKLVVRRSLWGVLVLLMGVALLLASYLQLPWIRTETVRFQSEGVTLVGTLALPRWRQGPYPAAVVVQGSGQTPRWIYWSYVRQLVPHGMAVLIYDKRGVGDSGGTPTLGTTWNIETIVHCGDLFEALARDVLAGVAVVAAREDVDRARIGLVGISQAGWIMPLAARQSTDVSFIVSISGPAVSCGMEDWYSQLTGEYRAYPEFQAPTPYAEGELSDADIERRLEEYDGPEGYDPVPVLATLRVPTLWLLGGRDRSVPTLRSVANLERLIATGAPFELKVYPEGDHVLTRSQPGASAGEIGMNRLFRRIDYWSDVRPWLIQHDMLPSS